MLQRAQKTVFVLALAAIALLAFSTTAELLPHHHDNINQSVCPICHPPLMGLQPGALDLPSLSKRTWAVNISINQPPNHLDPTCCLFCPRQHSILAFLSRLRATQGGLR
jgi:hypothetical protein